MREGVDERKSDIGLGDCSSILYPMNELEEVGNHCPEANTLNAVGMYDRQMNM